VVGFAAETHDMERAARGKLRAKKLDLVVANDVTQPGAGFGGDTNVVRLLGADGSDEQLPLLSKDDVAGRILDWIVARRPRRS
jgi:phosphopantothenoylcysteine decarboxylase/phosphopantothenate--cysteine ligase